MILSEGGSRKGFAFSGVDIDVVKIVEVLPIESSEDQHAATQEAGTVTAPRLGCISIYFECGNSIAFRV